MAEPSRTACGPMSCLHESVHDPPWVGSHGLRAPPTPLV
jgi:hypothetical protein